MSIKRSPRLLIVDDDPGVMAAYRLVLENAADRSAVPHMFGLDQLEMQLFGTQPAEQREWRIAFLDQGLDAVNAVQWAADDGDPFTIIFLDVRMPPGMDGYRTAERIRKLDPNVHIVVVTGYSDYTYEDFLQIAGPRDRLTFLPKPVWPDELRKLARTLTAERSHRKAAMPSRVA